jgi:putative FmdB family regulatory protein
MPIYTYRCDNCGVQFDQKRSLSDPLLTVCPECNKKTIHRVYTPVGIVFKGSGFYATDHRSPSGQAGINKSHSEEKAASASESSKSETSSDSGNKSSSGSSDTTAGKTTTSESAGKSSTNNS